MKKIKFFFWWRYFGKQFWFFFGVRLNVERPPELFTTYQQQQSSHIYFPRSFQVSPYLIEHRCVSLPLFLSRLVHFSSVFFYKINISSQKQKNHHGNSGDKRWKVIKRCYARHLSLDNGPWQPELPQHW